MPKERLYSSSMPNFLTKPTSKTIQEKTLPSAHIKHNEGTTKLFKKPFKMANSSISSIYVKQPLLLSNSNNQYINETLFKLYEPVQRINRLKAKMAQEKQELLESTKLDKDKNRLSLINLQLNNQVQSTNFNSFKPNRSTRKRYQYYQNTSQINSKGDNKSSDWSRKSLFELPDAQEFLKSQHKKQINILISKYRPQKILEDELSRSSVLLSSLLSNPKIDHKKMYYYLKDPIKFLPPIKVDPVPVEINNKKVDRKKSAEEINIKEEFLKFL